MIMYSTVPIEVIFENYDKMKLNYREIQFGHINMVVEQLSGSEGKIVRLISPIAQDYLLPQYQPGNIIRFNPTL
ncbi:MAG: YlzJ-like family protein [Vulcanibacillus sp.]